MAHEKFTELELESQISRIMDSFNFEKVHKHMVDTNHQWYSPGGMSVPSLESIKTTARSLWFRQHTAGTKSPIRELVDSLPTSCLGACS